MVWCSDAIGSPGGASPQTRSISSLAATSLALLASSASSSRDAVGRSAIAVPSGPRTCLGSLPPRPRGPPTICNLAAPRTAPTIRHRDGASTLTVVGYDASARAITNSAMYSASDGSSMSRGYAVA